MDRLLSCARQLQEEQEKGVKSGEKFPSGDDAETYRMKDEGVGLDGMIG